ncbi:type II secretion system F family protein [Lactococcus hircilactis]|uniref:Type II secretion system F family protein n=1 Tax=Lactococcus hircilactis TaxID=1494462 RepID=A0A7X1Z9E7_9LACT|nr:competence type IV pilus assembly protein ComGB [Lactococcus hircilactis]MQW40286.1 type II secretion system F family protein [Lactococcus hircilactis]
MKIGTKKWINFLKQDISLLKNRKGKKLSLSKQAKLLQLMGNLLSNGFHLGEVVDFLSHSDLVEQTFVEKMRNGLASGKNLGGILQELNFSKNVITQIELAQKHGDLAGTLRLTELNIRKNLAVQKKLVSVSLYPIVLISFLIGIVLSLKNYLLPQISEGHSNFATALINHLPALFITSLILNVVIFLFFRIKMKKKSAFDKANLMLKIPVLKHYGKLYLTAYFAREWGNLIAQGIDLQEMFHLMMAQKSLIFNEMGQYLIKNLNSGVTFEKSVKEIRFFKRELALMIEYGEIKDKLGLELEIYSDECWTQFFSKIDQAIQVIQPVVFIFVALMIVLLYAAMLLPIYSNMGKMI